MQLGFIHLPDIFCMNERDRLTKVRRSLDFHFALTPEVVTANEIIWRLIPKGGRVTNEGLMTTDLVRVTFLQGPRRKPETVEYLVQKIVVTETKPRRPGVKQKAVSKTQQRSKKTTAPKKPTRKTVRKPTRK